MKIIKPTLIAAAVAMAGTAQAQQANQSLDMAVVIDESGSMAGEHNKFIGTYVDNLDGFLNNQGVTLNQYGLVGFGARAGESSAPSEAGREEGSALYRHFWLKRGPDDVWGSAQDFDNTTPELTTSGGTEDGYRAIDYTFRNFKFRSSSTKAIMLITDEDRDNDTTDLQANLPQGMTELEKSFIQSELKRTDTTVHAVVNQRFTDLDGNPAIAVVGDPKTGTAYVQQADGSIVEKTGFQFGSASSGTQADYSEVALATGGTVMDIDALRDVYTDTAALNALSGTLAQLVANITASGGGTVIGINCSAASGAAAQVCAAINAASSQNPGNTQLQKIQQHVQNSGQFRQLTQYQVGQMLQSALSNGRTVMRTLRKRMSSLRQAGTNVAEVQVMDYYDGNVALTNRQMESAQQMRGGAASGDRDGFGYFLRGHYTEGDFDGNDSTSGYDSDTYTLVGGVDKYFNDQTQGGVALHYANSDAEYDLGAGGTDSDSYGLNLYGSHELGPNLYLEASLGYSRMEIDADRDTGMGMVSGSTDADISSASFGMLRDIPVTSTFAVQPFVYLNYQNVDLDGFTESGGAAALRVDESRLESLNWEMGLGAAYQVGTGTTATASVAWEHEFKDDSTAVTSAFAASPNDVFTVDVPRQDDNYGRVSLGLMQEIDGNRSVAVNADTIFGHSDYDEYGVMLQFRQQF
ncbi:MAG: autotransporter outer membrane beta-barrel domain-containing protein [Halomonas sp.]|uniref:autotransporter family protein n=1 Tax=Halomonas sp. TaxID=1486246 RepID=UPI0017DFAE05|nr:autotransporter outer membrane beta-barrel domain-containing protein [Halomonas sp.]NWN82209.1 autotransporter outer membrane beta-barrel domain-containing protein [Halomonas sp.]